MRVWDKVRILLGFLPEEDEVPDAAGRIETVKPDLSWMDKSRSQDSKPARAKRAPRAG